MSDNKDSRREFFGNLIAKNNEIERNWNTIVEKHFEADEKRAVEYKQSEQQRIITIVYGTALANVWGIFNLGQNLNIAFLFTSLIWALISYMIWFYSERMAFHSRDDERMAYFHQNCMYHFKKQIEQNVHLTLIVKNETKLANEQEEKNYLENELLRIQSDIKDLNNEFKISKIMSESLIKKSEAKQKTANNLGQFYIPAIFISWLMGIGGLLKNFYLKNSYLSECWGWWIMGTSGLMSIVATIYLHQSAKKQVSSKEKKF